jgi:hypothetical protein
VKIGKKVGEVVGVEVGLSGHHIAPMKDRVEHALIVGRGSAGKVGLLEDAAQRRSMQRLGDPVIMALRAVHLKDLISMNLLGVKHGKESDRASNQDSEP